MLCALLSKVKNAWQGVFIFLKNYLVLPIAFMHLAQALTLLPLSR